MNEKRVGNALKLLKSDVFQHQVKDTIILNYSPNATEPINQIVMKVTVGNLTQ